MIECPVGELAAFFMRFTILDTSPVNQTNWTRLLIVLAVAVVGYLLVKVWH